MATQGATVLKLSAQVVAEEPILVVLKRMINLRLLEVLCQTRWETQTFSKSRRP